MHDRDFFYETDLLVLMPRNAVSLYAYWEVSKHRKRMVESHFQCGWDALPKVLRLYDTSCISFDGDNANSRRDITMDSMADNWIINEANDNCSYCVDYGTTALDGRFIAILRSNTVKTPRSGESGSQRFQTGRIDTEGPSIHLV